MSTNTRWVFIYLFSCVCMFCILYIFTCMYDQSTLIHVVTHSCSTVVIAPRRNKKQAFFTWIKFDIYFLPSMFVECIAIICLWSAGSCIFLVTDTSSHDELLEPQFVGFQDSAKHDCVRCCTANHCTQGLNTKDDFIKSDDEESPGSSATSPAVTALTTLLLCIGSTLL